MESVWSDCKDVVAKADLRLAMIEQMTKELPLISYVYGEYTKDKDKIVKDIVDQAMLSLPKELSAEMILKNRDSILSNFKALSLKYNSAITNFLTTSRGAIPDRYQIKWYSKLPVHLQVAHQVLGKVSPQYNANVKRAALDDVISEVRVLLKEPSKGGFAAVSGLFYGKYTEQRDAVVDQMVDDLKERLRRDAGVTAEMLYNNRANLLGLVKSEVQQHKKVIADFLNKLENKGKDLSDLKERWKAEGAKVTDAMSQSLSRKFKENITVAAKAESALESLKADMMNCARGQIKATEKKGGLPRTSSKYHVERDTGSAKQI